MRQLEQYSGADQVRQKNTDETAAIVYETAKRALDSENGVYRASLVHDEEPHINLGRAQEWIPDVDEELQFRRWGGGGYVVHSDTYCGIDARVKNGPKEMTSLQRERMAHQTLEALSEVYDDVGVLDTPSHVVDLEGELIDTGPGTVYYDPSEGDIYRQNGMMPRSDDPQMAGIGLAEIEIDDQWVQIGRVCMYPKQVSEEAAELDRNARKSLELDIPALNKRVEPVENFEGVAEALNGQHSVSYNAEDFMTSESRVEGEKLQKSDGFRGADPCF